MKRPAINLGVTSSLPTRVAEHLSREIHSGRIAPESRLPPETSLAAELGVSRNVVREAISQLRADGLIYVRQGSGAYALPPQDSKVIRLDPQSLGNANDLGQLFELRAILETEAAGLAATRLQASGLDVLADALKRMQGHERTRDDSVAGDLEFYRIFRMRFAILRPVGHTEKLRHRSPINPGYKHRELSQEGTVLLPARTRPSHQDPTSHELW